MTESPPSLATVDGFNCETAQEQTVLAALHALDTPKKHIHTFTLHVNALRGFVRDQHTCATANLGVVMQGTQRRLIQDLTSAGIEKADELGKQIYNHYASKITVVANTPEFVGRDEIWDENGNRRQLTSRAK